MGLHGPLPARAAYRHSNGSVVLAYPAAEIIDLSETSLSGSLLDSLFNRFFYLQVDPVSSGSARFELFLVRAQALYLQDTLMSGPLPAWADIDRRVHAVGPGSNERFKCPAYISRLTGARVVLSPQYYSFDGCECSEGYFGRPPDCALCTDESDCECHGATLSHCMPLGDGTFLPCQRFASGSSACNPNGDVLWPQQQQQGQQESDEDALASPPDGFCADGYESRLCSQCARSFFAQGQECVKCPPRGVDWLIGVGYAVCFALLVLFLYFRSVRVETTGASSALLAILL